MESSFKTKSNQHKCAAESPESTSAEPTSTSSNSRKRSIETSGELGSGDRDSSSDSKTGEVKKYKDEAMADRLKEVFDDQIAKVIEVELKKGGPIDFKTLLAPARKLLEQDMEIFFSNIKKYTWCFVCEQDAIYYCCNGVHYCSRNCQLTHWKDNHKGVCRIRVAKGNLRELKQEIKSEMNQACLVPE